MVNSIFSLAMPKISFGIQNTSDWFVVATAGYATYASAVWAVRGFLSSATIGRINID